MNNNVLTVAVVIVAMATILNGLAIVSLALR